MFSGAKFQIFRNMLAGYWWTCFGLVIELVDVECVILFLLSKTSVSIHEMMDL